MAQNSPLMQGKRGVVLGVANNRSIAWGIAKACHAAGAEIALTWQGDALKKRVEPLAKELNGILLGHCDVTDAATIDAVFDVLKEKWGKIELKLETIDTRYWVTTEGLQEKSRHAPINYVIDYVTVERRANDGRWDLSAAVRLKPIRVF